MAKNPALPAPRRVFEALRQRAFARIDIAWLVFFRVAFGLLMIWDMWLHFSRHLITLYWVQPTFAFKYFGFSWVNLWPGDGIYLHCTALALLGLLVAAGLFYRISTTLLCLGHTYLFLLDGMWANNHAYLICLFCFLLIFMPANRALSLDVWLNPKLRSQTTPEWTLWLLRLQIGVVYFFGGVAKILPDWLRGSPMRERMAQMADFPIVGQFFREEWAVYLMSYGGLLLDLAIVPLLLWRRSRVFAFGIAVIFHLTNARLFSIGVFPWLAIAATTVFFPPDWPRRILSILRPGIKNVARAETQRPSYHQQVVILTLIAVYVAIQLVVPLRHFLSRGGLEWSHAEHRFSWRMMLIDQTIRATFYVTDPTSGETRETTLNEQLTKWQLRRFSWHPDLLLQLAHHLASESQRTSPNPVEVRARILVSFNGRKPVLVANPNVDLAKEPRTCGRPRWVLQVNEPLPRASGQDHPQVR